MKVPIGILSRVAGMRKLDHITVPLGTKSLNSLRLRPVLYNRRVEEMQKLDDITVPLGTKYL